MNVATKALTLEDGLADLISPVGGVVSSLDRLAAPASAPETIMRACVGDDDLICVCIDHQISVVSDHNHLALGLAATPTLRLRGGLP